MGGTQSKTTSEILTEIAINVTQENIARCIQAATQDQLIEVHRVAGDVTISGTTMEQGMSVDMQCTMSSEMQSDLQAKIAAAVSQYANAEGIALLSALGSTEATVENDIAGIFDAHVRQTNLQEAVQQSMQKQGVIVTDVGGNAVIRNVSMKQTMEVMAKAIITSSGYTSAIADISNKIDQSAKAKETGPLDSLFKMIGNITTGWFIMIIGIVLVGGLILIFFLKYLFTTETGAALVASTTEMAKSQLGAGAGTGTAIRAQPCS